MNYSIHSSDISVTATLVKEIKDQFPEEAKSLDKLALILTEMELFDIANMSGRHATIAAARMRCDLLNRMYPALGRSMRLVFRLDGGGIRMDIELRGKQAEEIAEALEAFKISSPV